MDLMEAVRARHSVRNYTDRPIEGEVLKALEEEIAACNREAGLHIQLVRDEPRAFDSTLAHYGSFTGVRNYLAMIGPKDGDLMEKCGYYGERIVLKAQMLGLNTCWVALTFKKIPDAYVVGDEKKPITFSIHRRMMERIRRTIDLHGACSHVFRHSFATMLNDAGASVKTIQSIIGQKDFKTTADRYCHPRDNRKQEAVEGVDKLLCS